MYRTILAVALSVCATVCAAETPYSIDMINAGADRVEVISLAPSHGAEGFRRALDKHSRPITLESGETVTLTFYRSEGGCNRDVRVKFANGKVWQTRMFDVCNQRLLRLGGDTDVREASAKP